MKKLLFICLAVPEVFGMDLSALLSSWRDPAPQQQHVAEAEAYGRANAANDLAGVAGALENGSDGYNAVEQARILFEGLRAAGTGAQVLAALTNAGLGNALDGVRQELARLAGLLTQNDLSTIDFSSARDGSQQGYAELARLLTGLLQ